MPSEPRKRAKPKTEVQRLSRGRTREGAIFPVSPSAASLPGTYAATLQEIKSHLRSARVRAILAANPIVIEAYWNTGKIILARKEDTGWGGQSHRPPCRRPQGSLSRHGRVFRSQPAGDEDLRP